MTHTVVSSFSPEGYREYGHLFLESFEEFWPEEVRLVIFFEEGQLIPADTRAEFVPISEVSDLAPFLEAVNHFPLLRGEQAAESGTLYNIRFDARMARKTFIEAYAVETFGGKVFWIDADVVTHEKIPREFLDDMLPDDRLCCYLGREQLYTESGFIGFNAGHPQCKQFIGICRQCFETGAFLTFSAWHDCVAFDLVLKAFEEEFESVSANLGAGVDPGEGQHVFVNSILGKYMDHKKGQRKSMLRSPNEDLTVKRVEPYWQ